MWQSPHWTVKGIQCSGFQGKLWSWLRMMNGRTDVFWGNEIKGYVDVLVDFIDTSEKIQNYWQKIESRDRYKLRPQISFDGERLIPGMACGREKQYNEMAWTPLSLWDLTAVSFDLTLLLGLMSYCSFFLPFFLPFFISFFYFWD